MRRPALALGFAALLALAATAAACGGSDDDGGNADALSEISAEVASFDLAAGRDERFIIGFFTGDNRILAYGDVRLQFGFFGADPASGSVDAALSEPVEATFLPIAGQPVDADEPGPVLVAQSEARGVYRATAVRFDQPGFWAVNVEGTADGEPFEVGAGFEVKPAHQVVAAGEPAPRTDNPVVGAPGVDPLAIDSRADDGEIPDPELHSTTVAGALAAGRPVVVVVSTPTFCVSRFCGPITEEIQKLAQEFGDRVDFVHLEVWQDFEAQAVNPSAAEWIAPRDGGDLREPWVFVVGADGLVTERFDNAVSDADLRRAVEAVAG
ncbi:MAG TPA: hypothetical protein VMQ81_09680 [Acidimicrobiia bacterium]|nr:hypothetical protein [Acidimicrobiia bacterium]